MSVLIREMTMEDIDAVMEVEEEAFAIPWSRSSFESEVAQNFLAVYLVAENEEGIAGYGGLWFILDEAHITNVAVKAAARRQGIGRRLVEALIEKAAERDIQKLTLEVRESNREAIALYEKTGFAVEGRRPGYYQDNKEDALIMWKRN